MKTACIIQGDIRGNFEIVLDEMKKYFDIIIISTWKGEEDKIPKDNSIKIFSAKPKNKGYSHRNYQRYSTARGIEKAKELGASYVLKWRADMLPTKLNIKQLINWANYDIPKGMTSRLVTCAYRNLTVEEDWFSSMPDLFAFGTIDTMELLWGDEGFDYTQMMNPPEQMLVDEGIEWTYINDDGRIWCAESELYAIFKNRLEKKLSVKLTHEMIAKNYMRLFNHEKLGIVWFGKGGELRSIVSSLGYPWWTENSWKNSKVLYVKKYYVNTNMIFILRGKLRGFFHKYEIYKQNKFYYEYKINNQKSFQ